VRRNGAPPRGRARGSTASRAGTTPPCARAQRTWRECRAGRATRARAARRRVRRTRRGRASRGSCSRSRTTPRARRNRTRGRPCSPASRDANHRPSRTSHGLQMPGLGSARIRRRAGWAGALVAVAAAAAAAVLMLPKGTPEHQTLRPGAEVVSTPRAVKLTAERRRAIDELLDAFVPAAMERKKRCELCPRDRVVPLRRLAGGLVARRPTGVSTALLASSSTRGASITRARARSAWSCLPPRSEQSLGPQVRLSSSRSADAG
jgi:hypothetical protein